MSGIGNLPNIGRALEEKLKQASMDESACLNMLYALEGALQGIRWHYLLEEDKEDLKKFFESVKI